ncbi:MAG: non-canonical purine NTP pyrophosphatase [Candidatus Babeliales bacterium]
MNILNAARPSFSDINQLYYVTGNAIKLQEASDFFKKYASHITLQQCDLDIPEIQTLDQKTIALDKARAAWQTLKQPVLVDDTAVFFDAYPDFPGTMTKFVYKTLGLPGIFKLIETGQRMHIRIVLVFMYGDNEYAIIEETIHGTITTCARLDLHRKEAPFDTIFIPDGATQTVDELVQEDKGEPYQYRMRALKKFLAMFESNACTEQPAQPKYRYFVQNKLWRDKMPRQAQEQGSVIHTKYLTDQEFDHELRLKLLEEAKEVKAAITHAELIHELADVYEVIDALCVAHNIDVHDIITTQMQKRSERGGFMERKYVTIAEHPEGSYLAAYCLKAPAKYPEIK